MIYVRVTRDSRGYEHTFLLHSPHTGERPRVLYWYRSAPGIRVGRPAFDEDAIRAIDEQHPDIEFDWTELIEEAQTALPEVVQRPERRRAPRPRPPAPEVPRLAPASTASDTDQALEPPTDEAPAADLVEPEAGEVPGPTSGASVSAAPNPLIEQLVGREIASRLRRRYRELSARIAESDRDEPARAAWQALVQSLDPDRWDTPESVLKGIEDADRTVEELKRLGVS